MCNSQDKSFPNQDDQVELSTKRDPDASLTTREATVHPGNRIIRLSFGSGKRIVLRFHFTSLRHSLRFLSLHPQPISSLAPSSATAAATASASAPARRHLLRRRIASPRDSSTFRGPQELEVNVSPTAVVGATVPIPAKPITDLQQLRNDAVAASSPSPIPAAQKVVGELPLDAVLVNRVLQNLVCQNGPLLRVPSSEIFGDPFEVG
ncbi:hypothetical protein SDJN02_24100, partial [Cucurbita argyrosperma subsp. argyrosperma]